MNVSETLHKAADLIEERGWAQGVESWGGVDPGGPLCIEGAIAAAMGKVVNSLSPDNIWPQDLNGCPAAEAVREHIEVFGWLCIWNDDRNRTASEVVEVLRATALIAEARERQDGLGGFVGGLVATA